MGTIMKNNEATTEKKSLPKRGVMGGKMEVAAMENIKQPAIWMSADTSSQNREVALRTLRGRLLRVRLRDNAQTEPVFCP
jgi:hypothetical protein